MKIYPDSQIISLIEGYMQGSQNPDLLRYREQSYQRDFADKQRFLWSLKHVAALGGVRNKRILDVGCGFGWQAFTISLLDNANKVTGIDILPSMIDGMTECVQAMRRKGVVFDLTPMCGDICSADLPANSFDFIYSIEAIEHVHDMEQMVATCFRLLERNGRLILVNDQNILNRETREHTVAMWKDRESSWKWAEFLRSIRPIEHKDARPFAVMREEAVRTGNPNLTPAVVQTLVEVSAGMLTPDIEALAANYKPGMKLPMRPEYDWCRNPETGEYAERLFDPFALADLLKRAGFRTKVRHLFRKFPLNLANGIQSRTLNNLLFNLRPVFVLQAEKAA